MPIAHREPLTVWRLDVAPSFLQNLSVNDILAVMIQNRIPPEWMAHRYIYGAQYIHKHIVVNSMEHEFFLNIDAECIQSINGHGIPPTIPEWDEWHTPSSLNVAHIWHLMDKECLATPTPYRSLGSNTWFLLGEDIFTVSDIGPWPVIQSLSVEALPTTASLSVEGVVVSLSASISVLSLNAAMTDGNVTMMGNKPIIVGGSNDSQASTSAGGSLALGGSNDPQAHDMAVDILTEGSNDPQVPQESNNSSANASVMLPTAQGKSDPSLMEDLLLHQSLDLFLYMHHHHYYHDLYIAVAWWEVAYMLPLHSTTILLVF